MPAGAEQEDRMKITIRDDLGFADVVKTERRKFTVTILVTVIVAVLFCGLWLTARGELRAAEADARLARAELDAKSAYAEQLTIALDGKVAETAGLEAQIAEKDAVIADQQAEIESLK
jgi:ribose 1,5-bisphosphokinase PhnN